MARDRNPPTRDPARQQRSEPPDPEDARTPPARPDERGEGKRHAAEIAETVEDRTTSADDPPHGTSFTTPEEIAGARKRTDRG